jgi:hypothetical protein
MKRLAILFVMWTAAALGCSAQVTYTVPQSQQNTIFSAVTTARTSGCLANQGQNIWFSNYVNNVASAGRVQYRLEYSYNSDAATCTTGTWFAMSDDATDTGPGEVIGIGNYPYVRANLMDYQTSAGSTFTAFYSTSSSSPGNLYGFYNPSQQIRKVIYENVDATVNATGTQFAAPYGSGAGTLIVVSNGATFSSAALNVSAITGSTNASMASLSLSGAGPTFVFQMPATAATSLKVNYSHGATASGTFSLYWILYPPGGALPPAAQPSMPSNSETVSAVNTAATVTLTPGFQSPQSVYIFSVSARCSAGTASLTIADSTQSKNVWTSAGTEVGTTTFKYQWNPGLNASLTVSDTVTITLSTCGAGNTGTMNVQASIF